jgi:hypothetical protein
MEHQHLALRFAEFHGFQGFNVVCRSRNAVTGRLESSLSLACQSMLSS